MLYVYAGLSLRQCSKAMEVFNYMLQGSIKKVPAYTTVKTWVEKAGLSIYKNRSHKEIEGAYAAIVDGSISSGNALADMDMPNHRDVSHSFGTFLKNVYAEDESFKAFMEDMGKTRRYALTSVAYLMPPKQRSIALLFTETWCYYK